MKLYYFGEGVKITEVPLLMYKICLKKKECASQLHIIVWWPEGIHTFPIFCYFWGLHVVKSREKQFQLFRWCSVFITVGLNTLCCFVLFICIPWWFIVTSKRYFSTTFFLCVFPQSGAATGRFCWQWAANSGHVWEGRLSCCPQFFHAVIKAADSVALSAGLFFSGPTAHCHTFWWRDTDRRNRAPSVWSPARSQARLRSCSTY